MTAIAGIVHDGKVYIGGDSAGVAGLSLQTRLDPKVFTVGGFVIGYTSSFRMGQLLRFRFSPPAHHDDVDTYRYMVTDWVDAVRQVFKDGGFATTKDGAEAGGLFVVGYRGRLFEVNADYQVAELADGFTAVGCGFDLCLGSLWSTRSIDMRPEDRIRLALSAAERFSGGVRGPFIVEREP